MNPFLQMLRRLFLFFFTCAAGGWWFIMGLDDRRHVASEVLAWLRRLTW